MAAAKKKAGFQWPSCPSDDGDYLPVHSRQPLSSLPKTFANLVLCVLGSGVLGLPYTFSRIGWLMGTLTLIASSAVAYHGMMLQVYSKRRLRRSRRGQDLIILSYGDLMYQAFGRWGQLGVDALLVLSTFAGTISYVTFISQNAASIASGFQGTHLLYSDGFHTEIAQAVVSNNGGNLSNFLSEYNSSQENHTFLQSSHGNLSELSSQKQIILQLSNENHTLLQLSHGNLSELSSQKQSLQYRNENHTFLQFSHGNLSELSSQKQSLQFSNENHTLLQFSHGNLSELGPQKTSFQAPFGNQTELACSNLIFPCGSASDGILKGLNWLSSSTYTWAVFPFEVALAAIKSVTLLAPFSAVGDLLSLAALAVVMVYDVITIQKTAGFGEFKAFRSMVAVPSAFGVGVYAFQSSGTMIPIEAAMEDPSKLGSTMGLAFTLCLGLYVMFAVLGYAAFGEKTEQVITLNLPSGVETMVIKSVICLSLFLAFPLVLNPMFELVERRFSRRKVSLALRALIVFVICLLATTVRQFTVFLSLAGSSISCLAGFILPAAVHIKVMKEDADNPPTRLLYAMDFALIGFGVILGAFGTTVSFIELLG